MFADIAMVPAFGAAGSHNSKLNDMPASIIGWDMASRRQRRGAGTLPMFLPDSPWAAPAELPASLLGRPEVAIDVETCDEGLQREMGSGWPWAGGYICGFSVAAAGEAVYIPIRHPETQNFPQEIAFAWLREVVKTAGRVLTHSGWYDYGFIGNHGIAPPAAMDDTLAMAVMLDENRRAASLDAVCMELGLPGKDMGLLREAGAAYGFHGDKELRANLWRLPARFVGPYGMQDAAATLAAAALMRPRLEAEDLGEAYKLEVELMPCVVEMRRRGIRVDLDSAVQVQNELRRRRDGLCEEIRGRLNEKGTWRSYGVDELRSPFALERAHDQEGVAYPRTPKTGRGSFRTGKVDGWMKDHPHWLPRAVAKARKLDEFAEKFIGQYILKFAQRGRVHPEIHQLRDADGGTRTMRFSYSAPPLQQTPKREDELAALIRGIFLPEGGEHWCSNDIHSQEYRLWVHFAALTNARGADLAVAKYRENPKTDFHQMVADWTGLPRPSAKDANFARGYGAGVRKFAAMIGKSEADAKEIFDQYDREMPFVSDVARAVNGLAERRGYLKLINGARVRFNTWEPATYGESHIALPRAAAEARWPGQRLRRAGARKGFNSLVQGSAAIWTKLAMRTCWREGLVPLLQMHDELGHSVDSEAQGLRVAEIMRDAVTLRVPAVTDTLFGNSWGSVRHGWA